MSKTLMVYEIFSSIMGEYNAFGQGVKATFIRLSGCNLKCSYCDTAITQDPKIGSEMSLGAIFGEVQHYRNRVICITGGEPLLQKQLYNLVLLLEDNGYYVVVETNGSIDISKFPSLCNVIMDWKLEFPDKMKKSNIKHLEQGDAVKFVISSEEEFHKCVKLATEFAKITDAVMVFSPNTDKISAHALFELFSNTEFVFRAVFSLQIHKVIGCR